MLPREDGGSLPVATPPDPPTATASGASGLTSKPQDLPLAGPGEGGREPTPRPRGMPGAVPGPGRRPGSLHTREIPAQAAILGPLWRSRRQAGAREAC